LCTLINFQIKNLIIININNQNFFVKEDISIFEACNSVGIEIPRFCYHESLSVPGNCRMCLVDNSFDNKNIHKEKDDENEEVMEEIWRERTDVIDVKVQKSKAEFTKNLFTLNIIKSKYFDKLKSIYQNKKAQEKELNSLSTKLSYKEIKFLTFGDIEKKHLELPSKSITNKSRYKLKYGKNEITDLAKVFSDSESKYIIIKELNRQLKNLFSIIINQTDNVIPVVNKEEILKVIKKYFNLSDDDAKIKFLEKNLDLSTKEKSLKTFYFTVFLQTENEKALKKKMSVEEARFTVLETFTFLNEY